LSVFSIAGDTATVVFDSAATDCFGPQADDDDDKTKTDDDAADDDADFFCPFPNGLRFDRRVAAIAIAAAVVVTDELVDGACDTAAMPSTSSSNTTNGS
jgi:hypothetical protein